MKNGPLLICLSSTRNYGWVINAFLKANSIWADYIIIVDQNSTDGSREIIACYDKVILIDDDSTEYSETKRSTLAIEAARKIQGDKILFYLAIDEVLPANFKETKDWTRILNSQPGDVFFFYWANLYHDKKQYWISETNDHKPFYMARLFHDDSVTPYNNEGLDMHTHCIPYPDDDSNKTFYINDFMILHFGGFNLKWNDAKQRFYQMVDFDKNNRSMITLSRMYKTNEIKKEFKQICPEWIYTQNNNKFNLFEEVKVDSPPILDNYVLDLFKKNGLAHYKRLDIWDKSFIINNGIKDPRSIPNKIIHIYLHLTSKLYNRFWVRAIDKILKKLKF